MLNVFEIFQLGSIRSLFFIENKAMHVLCHLKWANGI